MDEHRIINSNGNKSEWIRYRKNKLIEIIEDIINKHDNEEKISNDNGIFLLQKIIEHTMLGKPLDEKINVITYPCSKNETNGVEKIMKFTYNNDNIRNKEINNQYDEYMELKEFKKKYREEKRKIKLLKKEYSQLKNEYEKIQQA